MIAKYPKIIELLELTGAHDINHSGRTLFEHLSKTCELLESLGASKEVCMAGALHSIYGTTVFKNKSLDIKERPLVKYVVGEYAERLAYLFCRAPRPFEVSRNEKEYYLTTVDGSEKVSKKELNNLTLICAANSSEQRLSKHRLN